MQSLQKDITPTRGNKMELQVKFLLGECDLCLGGCHK
jgi:hypothetical protein